MHPDRSLTHVAAMVLLCLLPLLLLLLDLAGGISMSPWLFALFLLLCLAAMYNVIVGLAADTSMGDAVYRSGMKPADEVPESLILKTIDIIYPHTSYRAGNRYVVEGPLMLTPEAAYRQLMHRFSGSALTPLLQQSEAGHPMLVLAPAEDRAPSTRTARRIWLPAVLLVATLATTTWAGAAHQGIDLLETPGRIAAGWPYAGALMLILAAHELGHYAAARRRGVEVSLPFFIPAPFALGTFGAYVQVKSLAPDRRALFDVAVAGPLAGLVFALPALIVGLGYSTVVPAPGTASLLVGGADAGSSVLLAFLAKLTLGEAVLEGHRLILHPIAFAGWLGLLVTALNLLPVGWLDGGHLSHALLGRRTARTVGIISLLALVLLGLFVWSGLLFWALLIFLIAGIEDTPPRNDVSRVGTTRLVLGAFVLVLLLLILVPVPPVLYGTLGLHSPYV